ncbi:phenylpyruvate tautomerase PptA (4-oxalocrotonate tautomerase family) [Paraburkholderia sp. GAS199]|uniref:tautomerase family protein n=1 Tax=Paraburkholderia sp. GAS199 TaxID=3035126 RepID=UPI003D1FB7F4
MPFAKIYFQEGQYTEAQLDGVSEAVHDSLTEVLSVPDDHFFQVLLELPKSRYRHTKSFSGINYTDAMLTLEILFISGRDSEARRRLLKTLNKRIVEATGISPNDVFINLTESSADNFSFGRGEAQRA